MKKKKINMSQIQKNSLNQIKIDIQMIYGKKANLINQAQKVKSPGQKQKKKINLAKNQKQE